MGEVVKMSYQFTVRIGDIVKLPSRETGTIKFVDLVAGGNSKIVFVEPDVVWHKRWRMHFSGKLWFRDKEINKLVLLTGEEKARRGVRK